MPIWQACVRLWDAQSVIEDEPLIALDVGECFRRAGAFVLTVFNLRNGLRLAGDADLSAAVVDFVLSDGEGTAVCERLNERGIAFVLHSGYSHVHEACRVGVVVPKPAKANDLVVTIASLLHVEAGPWLRRSAS
jgi:DNA-binding response OmpR family regulator